MRVCAESILSPNPTRGIPQNFKQFRLGSGSTAYPSRNCGRQEYILGLIGHGFEASALSGSGEMLVRSRLGSYISGASEEWLLGEVSMRWARIL